MKYLLWELSRCKREVKEILNTNEPYLSYSRYTSKVMWLMGYSVVFINSAAYSWLIRRKT